MNWENIQRSFIERQHGRQNRHSSTSSGWGTSGKTAARQEKPSSVKEKRPPPQRMPPPAAAGRGVYVNQKGEQDGFGRGRQFRKARRPLVPDEPTGLDGWIPRSEQQKRLQNSAAKPDEYVELIAQCEANPGKFLGTQYCLRLVLGTQPLEEFIRQRAWGKEQLKEWDITTDWQAYERKLATDETSPSPTTTGNTSADAVVVVNNADNGDDPNSEDIPKAVEDVNDWNTGWGKPEAGNDWNTGWGKPEAVNDWNTGWGKPEAVNDWNTGWGKPEAGNDWNTGWGKPEAVNDWNTGWGKPEAVNDWNTGWGKPEAGNDWNTGWGKPEAGNDWNTGWGKPEAGDDWNTGWGKPEAGNDWNTGWGKPEAGNDWNTGWGKPEAGNDWNNGWGTVQLKEWDSTTDWQAYERKLATDETSPSPTTTGGTSADAVVVVNNADNDVSDGNGDEPNFEPSPCSIV